MTFYNSDERLYHGPRPCEGCQRFSLRRGPKAGMDSGVRWCRGVLWRVIRDPGKQLMRNEGRAVCLEEEIWHEVKTLGVTTVIAYVGDEIWLADSDTFERHKVEVPLFQQVGLPRRYWQRRPRSAGALQTAFWSEEAVA